MKKLLALVLVMILSLTALVSCEMPESVDGILDTVKDKVGGITDTIKDKINTLLGKEPTPEEPEEPEEPEVVYDVAAAKEYLYTLYINSSVQTPNDYTLVKQVYINRVPHPVVWTTNTELVKIVENETDVTVDVDEKSAEDLPYTLTATITAGGKTESVSFERMVPAYNLLTYAQYLEKQTNDSVTIEGIVTLVRSQSKGNTRDQLFIQDVSGEGGYYVYYTKEDYVDKLGLKVGMTVSVTGIKEIYQGNTHEIKDAVVTIKNDGAITELAPTDITALFANAKDSKDAALMGKLGMLVTIKGAVIGDQDLGEKAKYLYFEIDGVTTYVRVYTTDLGVGIMTSEQEAQIFTDHANHRDYTANITGVVDTYSGAIYISPVGPTPFEYLSKVERTPDEKVDIAVSEIELPEIVTEATEITLPAEGKTYSEVKFAWESGSEYAVVKDGKLVITLPEENTVVTVTLTATLEGAETVTETYNIKLIAPAKNPFVAEQTPNPATGTAYKFFVYNAFHGKNFFFNGTINDKFLQSSDNYAEAVDVYLEEAKDAEGKVIGYRFYFMNGETKTYIDITAEGKAALVTENPTAVYNYVAETNCWAAKVGEKECYIGSYVYNNSSYTTFGASETKYIKADNTGVTQFPANFATLRPATLAPEQAETPEVDTAYKFFVYNAFHGKNFFFNGAISGNFLQSSDNIAEAVDVYLEEVKENDKVVGYRFYFMNGETKTYIDINAEGKAALVTENPNAVYNYKAETNCWVTAAGEKECYIGSYVYNNSSYTTFGASETKYIKPDNTGVTQFPANFATLTVKKVVAEQVKTPAAVTPYKFFVFNVHHNDFFYFNGSISGNFLQTTNNIYNAVDVYLEEVKESDKVVGYRFYFMDGETKTYIDINESGKAALVTENPTAVYNYVAETNCWAAKVGTLECYIGSYLNKGKSYTTFGASETKYIKPDNTGVTQFPANFGIMVIASDKVITDEEKVATEKDDLKVQTNFVNNGVLELPAAGETYTEVTITWTATGAEIVDGKITIVRGDEVKTFTLVATITSGEVTETKEFTVTVAKNDAIVTPDMDTTVAIDTSKQDNSYTDRKTTAGWELANAAYLKFNDDEGMTWVLNGKSTACGKVTSPVLTGALTAVNFSYGFPFSDTQFKMTVSIVDAATGAVLVSHVVEKTGLDKLVAYDYSWTLTAEEAAKVTGSYKIVFENNALSEATGNKDRLSLWDIQIVGAEVVVATENHTHTDDNTDGICDGCQQEVDATGDTPLTGADAN